METTELKLILEALKRYNESLAIVNKMGEETVELLTRHIEYQRENDQLHRLDVPEDLDSHDCKLREKGYCPCQDLQNRCGKPHNNAEGEESCGECTAIKLGI